MPEIEMRHVLRRIETKRDAFLFGAAEALGKGLVWAVIFAALVVWLKQAPETSEPEAPAALSKEG